MSKVYGIRELSQALDELGDINRSEWRSVMRSAVRNPMRRIQARAVANIAKISPGKTLMHRTYLGRLVGRGFASRSIRMIVKFSKQVGSVTAILGVKAEAFYAIQFFEKGTSKIPRQPWLVPAFEAMKDTAVADVSAALAKRVKAVAKKWAKKAKVPAAGGKP